MFESLFDSEQLLRLWVLGLVVVGIAAGVASGFFKARKIQPNAFKWRIFRWEVFGASVTAIVSGSVLGAVSELLLSHGILRTNEEPVAYWVIGLEYALYFLAFDTWFYWLHRWMHKESIYGWVHKWHHKSTSPNLLTTFSVNPLESLVNGGFVPIFLSSAALVGLPLHAAAVALMVLTNIVMGLYVHSGYEFLPRWWNRSWATKWFISATFHDQHHKYFNWNYGGYTTLWDRLSGTMRPKFEADFAKAKQREVPAAIAAATMQG
jgi:Delta7-sterol 5-desaturase